MTAATPPIRTTPIVIPWYHWLEIKRSVGIAWCWAVTGHTCERKKLEVMRANGAVPKQDYHDAVERLNKIYELTVDRLKAIPADPNEARMILGVVLYDVRELSNLAGTVHEKNGVAK